MHLAKSAREFGKLPLLNTSEWKMGFWGRCVFKYHVGFDKKHKVTTLMINDDKRLSVLDLADADNCPQMVRIKIDW